jgi:hypothetical protein
MDSDQHRRKIDAIYELREAVEAKVNAEHALDEDGSAVARDALLAAQLELESKTQDAIDVCHECGHAHPAQAEHIAETSTGDPRITGYQDNVVHVDFRRESESA